MNKEILSLIYSALDLSLKRHVTIINKYTKSKNDNKLNIKYKIDGLIPVI